MAFAVNNQTQILLNTHDSRKLSGSRSHSRLTETQTHKASDTPTSLLFKNLSKNSIKTRFFLPKNANQPFHKRTISETSAKPSDLHIQIKTSLDLYEIFLQKLEKLANIESQVSELLKFLNESNKLCTVFSPIFGKISEIVKEYQKYVKSLDSTRVEMKDFMPDPKNAIFRSENAKMVKVRTVKKVFNDSFGINFSAESQKGICEEKQEFKPKLVIRAKREKSDEKKTVFRVPGLNLVETEKTDFHEEFMNKIDEFSESWRAEALKLKL